MQQQHRVTGSQSSSRVTGSHTPARGGFLNGRQPGPAEGLRLPAPQAASVRLACSRPFPPAHLPLGCSQRPVQVDVRADHHPSVTPCTAAGAAQGPPEQYARVGLTEANRTLAQDERRHLLAQVTTHSPRTCSRGGAGGTSRPRDSEAVSSPACVGNSVLVSRGSQIWNCIILEKIIKNGKCDRERHSLKSQTEAEPQEFTQQHRRKRVKCIFNSRR